MLNNGLKDLGKATNTNFYIMNTQKKLLIIPVLLALLLNSCIYDMWIEGNGDLIEEEREIPEFSKISSSGSFNVYYEYSDSIKVTVECESNLIMYIETFVYDEELKIRTPFNVNIRPSETIEVYVKGPFVDEISLSGSGLIHTGEIETDRLKLGTSGSGIIETTFYGDDLETSLSGSGRIDAYAECEYFESKISGSGKVYLEGEADRALYKVSGSGTFRGYDFEVANLEINVSGSGRMYVNATETMDVNISGSGNIHYIGKPSISTSITGSGNMIDEN